MVLSWKEYNFYCHGHSQTPVGSHGVSLLSFTCRLGSAILHTIISISLADFAKRHVVASPIKMLLLPSVTHASTLSAISATSLIRTCVLVVQAICSTSLLTIAAFVRVDTLQHPHPVCLAAM